MVARTVASRKSKGRKLQNEVVNKLREYYSAALSDGDIKPAVMGETGRDVKLSPLAKTIIPYDIECKNTERLDLWGSIKQCEENTSKDRIPLLIFKRNRSKTYAVLELDKLLELN